MIAHSGRSVRLVQFSFVISSLIAGIRESVQRALRVGRPRSPWYPIEMEGANEVVFT